MSGKPKSAFGSIKLFEMSLRHLLQEKRTLGNLGGLILEWGFEQLKTAGSTHQLLKYKIRSSTRQPRTTT